MHLSDLTLCGAFLFTAGTRLRHIGVAAVDGGSGRARVPAPVPLFTLSCIILPLVG